MTKTDVYGFSRYRLVWWKRWPILILGVLVVESLRAFPQVLTGVTNSDATQRTEVTGLVTLILFILLSLLFLMVGELLFSYLEVSPGGIKVRLWPIQTNEYTWDEMDSIRCNRIFGVFHYAILNLVKAHRVSFSSTTLMKQNVVLSDFRGWPNGGLAKELRLYAPHLFRSTEELQSQP